MAMYGISQGRLVKSTNGELQCFPEDKWKLEFSICKEIGLDYIELLCERSHNQKNPYWSDEGNDSIKLCAEEAKLKIHTSCLDYIINNSIYGAESKKTVEYTKNFIDRSKYLGVKGIIIPLLEKSDIREDQEGKVIEYLKKVSDIAGHEGIYVYVESVADSALLNKILDKVNNCYLKCVYDTGNRALLVQDMYSEILELGNKIGHVHIKDKDHNGNNVVLGTGNVMFSNVFKALKSLRYQGAYTFECTRGNLPRQTAEMHLAYIKFLKKEFFR